MKRASSQILLFVFLFHSAGYQLIVWTFRRQAANKLTERLDARDYSDNETTTFKIPLMVPYYTSSKDYQRVSGSFEHAGQFFRLIKQKLDRDTLFIVCIDDQRAKQLALAMGHYVTLSCDLAMSSQATSWVTISFGQEYIPSRAFFIMADEGWQQRILHSSKQFCLLGTDLPVPAQPPEFTIS